MLLPLGIALALRLIPAEVIAECRTRAAAAFAAGRPVSRSAALAIVAALGRAARARRRRPAAPPVKRYAPSAPTATTRSPISATMPIPNIALRSGRRSA